MKKVLCFVLSGFLFFAAFAQEEGELQVAPSGPEIKLNTNRLYGKVVDKNSNKGIEAISVQVYALQHNSNTNTVEDSLVAGMLTKPNGDFSFSDLHPADSLRLVISAVGYKNLNQTIPFSASHGGTIEKDLGNIILVQDVQYLGAVTVTAQRPALEMGIDRKIFNVEKNITAAGGTAIDIMKNIPSVTVDIDGNVQLRNNSPQIFVDGRPTILTLDQIPADNIERIELITNPSAKFDAASSGGIINVVLKRNKRIGLNGVVSAGAGKPGILNGNVTLNARQGKINFFASGSYNQSGGKAKGRTLRQNKVGGTVDNYFNQYSLNDRKRRFKSARFGLDFFLDNRNTLSVTQGLVNGKFDNNEKQDQEYLNKSKELERYGKRYSESNNKFDRYNSQFNYTHKFPQQGKELSANINYNYGGGNNLSNIVNTFYYPDGAEYSDPAIVRNTGKNDNDQLTMQVDFVNPKDEHTKFESGIRSFINNYHSIFSAFALNNGAETKLPLSNDIKYREIINAFYVTYSNKWKGIGYQAGLRAEYSRFDGTLIDSAKKFGYEYPNQLKQLFDALFPSLFLTKEVSDKVEMQLNYSRRIRRPNFWHLNPFININDPVNLSQGNPQLRPEFTNSFELNYSQKYGHGNFLGVLYYRNNQGDITRYSDTISKAQYQQLNNAGVDPNAILNTFINAKSNNRLGAEFTLQHKIGKNLELTPSVELQYRKVNADIGQLNLSNEGFNWESKLIANYKIETKAPSLFNNLGFQMIGEYESPEVVPQGKRLERYSVDVAMRKDFLKDKKASFTFSVNDVFNTYRFGAIYDTETFYQDFYRRRNVRSFRINITYKFGDSDFSIFRRNNTERSDADEG